MHQRESSRALASPRPVPPVRSMVMAPFGRNSENPYRNFGQMCQPKYWIVCAWVSSSNNYGCAGNIFLCILFPQHRIEAHFTPPLCWEILKRLFAISPPLPLISSWSIGGWTEDGVHVAWVQLNSNDLLPLHSSTGAAAK